MPTFQEESGHRTFQAGTGGVTKGRRVHLETDGVVEHAIASEPGIGIALRSAADGEMVPVRLWTAQGTFQCVASGVIGIGVVIEGAADGKFAAIGGAGVDMAYMNIGPATANDGDLFEAVALGTQT